MNETRILVVDDEEDLCEILKFNLENEGYEVDTANSAEEALQQINDKRYALPFEADGRKLFKIEINFSEKTRNIEKWVVES